MEDIVDHPWMTGPTPSQEDIVNEINSRQQLINQSIINSMEKKAQEKLIRTSQRKEKEVLRTLNLQKETFILNKELKSL